MLDLMMTLVVPLTLGLVAVYAACRRVDVYDALIQGAGEGLGTLARIIPSLVGLMTAVYMLRASGALDLAAQALAPPAGPGRGAGRAAPSDAGAPHQRERRPGGGGGAHHQQRAGLLCGPGGGGDAWVHGDHLLHHRGLLRRSGHLPDPVRGPRRPVR